MQQSQAIALPAPQNKRTTILSKIMCDTTSNIDDQGVAYYYVPTYNQIEGRWVHYHLRENYVVNRLGDE